MALAALRSSRSLGPLVRRLRPERRCIATATATPSPSASAALDHDGPALSLPQHIEVTNRRQAIKQAKPFSDFLTDKFNRQHDYLRISVTERCNLRCLYCMPEEGVPLSPSSHLLTTPEIVYLSELFVSQGVTKIRLTGGEPTVRPDILPLMQQIGSLKSKGLRELALTTNGISLHRKLDKMVEAGLTGVNISLDTLDPFQFQILTRRKGYDAVMKSVDRVLEMNKLGAGVKLKVNCVVMRGINEREIIPFVEMGREKDIEVRFIEYMPFGGNKWSERKMLTYQEMLDMIREKYPALRSVKGHLNDTSKTYEIPGFVGKIGFITSMTHNFCGTCNRLRITSDGNLKVCLHGNTEVSLRDLLRKDNNNNPMDEQAFEAIREIEMNRRQGLSVTDTRPSWIERETALLNLIGEAVKRKKEKHAGMEELQNMENRPMILIGGAIVCTIAFPNCQMDPYDTGTSTDLVVAEGGTLRGGLNNFKHRPMGSSRLGQAVPLHLLHSNIPNYHGARSYSSSTSSPLPQPSEEQTAEDLPTNVTPSLSPTPTPTDGSESGFASMRALFGHPRRSWSPPQPPAHETDAIADTQPERSTQEIDCSNNSFDGGLFEDPPDQLSATAEEEDGKAYEMLSSVPTIKTQHSEPSPAEQLMDTNDVKVVLQSSSPLPLRQPIARDGSEVSQRPHPFIRFKQAFKDPKATRAVEAAKNSKQPKPKPKPLPAWKVSSEDAQLTSPSDKRNVTTSTASASTKSLQSVQSSALPPTSLARGDVKRSEPSPARLGRSETDLLDSIESPLTSSKLRKAESSDSAAATTLTHLTSTGEAHMVDVGGKESTERVAVAVGFVHFSKERTYKVIAENLNKKGDVLGVARIAGIMAAKRCSDIIPLCHPIPITKITLNVGTMSPQNAMPIRNLLKRYTVKHGIAAVEARVHTRGQTGVEMEALTAVSGACLTIYDMCKAVDKDMVISGARVLYKEGGRSGTYVHKDFAKQPAGNRFINMDQDVSSREPQDGQ
ncbi:molybdenum cofactor biosynthesis prote, partial [Aureobasidium melanogenum]